MVADLVLAQLSAPPPFAHVDCRLPTDDCRLSIAVVALVLAQLVVALAAADSHGRLALAQLVALAALDLRLLVLVLPTPAAPNRLRSLR
jgi:hypothetical protein